MTHSANIESIPCISLKAAFVRVVKESPIFSIPYMTCLSYRTLPKQLEVEPFDSLHGCLLLPELLFSTCPQASTVSRKTIILEGRQSLIA